MGDSNKWYNDDGLWDAVAPYMFAERLWDEATEETAQLLGLLNLDPPAIICDLCCGPGRHALELARRGFTVTGVDRKTSFLQQAAQRAQQERLNVDFVRSDMREFRRDDSYDCVINLWTSFGYFEDPNDDRIVLANVLASLKPGGRFVLEMMGKEILARIFRARDWHEKADGVIFLEERTVVNDWSWMENRWILLKEGKRKEFRISHRIYSAIELKKMLEQSGFTSVEIYGSLAGTPYDNEAKRLVAVARK